jgi:hypothetical protein
MSATNRAVCPGVTVVVVGETDIVAAGPGLAVLLNVCAPRPDTRAETA